VDELTTTCAALPTEVGYADPAWSSEPLQSHISDTYGVEYSHPHMYRLLEKTGLSRQFNAEQN